MRRFSEIILEVMTPEQIRQKYYDDIDEKTFNRLVKVDPTSRYKNGELTKVGAFVKFIIKDYKRKIFKFEDADRYKEYISLYVKNRKRKELRGFDILKIDGIHELIDKLQFLKAEESGEIDELLKTLTKDVDYKLILNGDKWMVFQPLTEKGSCTLGFGTEWCTAWGSKSLDKSKRGRKNLFKDYKEDLYTLFSKETQKPVWQIHLDTKQFMDKNDTNLVDRPVGGYSDVADFFDKNIEVLYAIYPYLKDLDNPSKNLLMSVSHLTKYLPQSVSKKLREAYSSFLPSEIVNKIDGVINNISNLEIANELFKELFEDVVVEYIDRNEIELSGGDYRIDTDLIDLISYAASVTSYSDYDSDYIDDDNVIYYIDDTLEEILKNPNGDSFKLLKSLIPNVSSENFDLDKLKNLIGEKNFNTLKTTAEESIAGAESEARYDATRRLSNKVTDVWGANIFDKIVIYNDPLEFINYLKEYLVYSNYGEDDKYDFMDFVDFLNSQKNIPDSTESFIYAIHDDIDVNNEDIYENITVVLEQILEEIESERPKEQYNKLQKILNDLNFDDNMEMENETSKIKIFPESVDFKKETVKIEFVDNQNPEKSYTGTIPFESIGTYATNYNLFEEVVKIKKMMVI